MSEVKLYNIYWYDGTKRNHVVTTNNVDKWLEENNNQRIADGEESESLSDFEIEEVEAVIYSHDIEEHIECDSCYELRVKRIKE